jgi:hypothetical protein
MSNSKELGLFFAKRFVSNSISIKFNQRLGTEELRQELFSSQRDVIRLVYSKLTLLS